MYMSTELQHILGTRVHKYFLSTWLLLPVVPEMQHSSSDELLVQSSLPDVPCPAVYLNFPLLWQLPLVISLLFFPTLSQQLFSLFGTVQLVSVYCHIPFQVRKRILKKIEMFLKKEKVIPPGIEPGTLSVLDSRDNRYTMESTYMRFSQINIFMYSV